MGVKDFFKIVDHNKIEFGEHGKKVELSDLEGKNILVDGNLIAWQCMTARSEKTALRDREGNITQHLKFVMNKVIMFNNNGIRQTWVFDNPSQNPRKLETNNLRKKRSGDRLRLTSDHYEEIKELLKLMGIPIIIAPIGIEAEQYASWMTSLSSEDNEDAFDDNRYHYILSTDSDVMLFGGNMLRQYKKNKKICYSIFDHGDFMNKIEMDMEELFMVATVMGHDFYPSGIAGIACKTVYKKVKAGIVILDDEQTTALEQFTLNPDDYLHEVEFIQEDFNPDLVKEILISRDFKENLLDKQLNNFDTNLL